MGDKVRKLDALTGLRFLAAASIVVLHSGYFGVLSEEVCHRWHFGAAVDLFFILSGFILTYVYPRLEGAGDRGRFLLARFARLWPAHALGFVLVVLLFRPATPPVPGFSPVTVALLNLGMVHSWVPIHNVHFSYNGQSWSIATEFAFYLFFLVLIPGWRRTWHVKVLLAFLLAVAAPTLWRVAGLPGDRGPGGEVGLWFHPLVRLFEFTLGMAAALLWQKVAPGLEVGPIAGTLLEVASVALVVASLAPPLSGLAGRLPAWLTFASGWVGRLVLCDLPLALLILVLASGWGGVSRLLGSRPAVLLGEISYTLYILHGIVLRYYAAHQNAFAGLSPGLVYGGYWLILLVLCHLVWVGLERPARQWLVGLWPRPAGAGSQPPRSVSLWWQRLTAPGRRLVAAEALVLACLLVPVVAYANRPPYRFLSARAARKLAARSVPSVRGTCFGDRFVLRAAVLNPLTNDGLRLELVWESRRAQPAPGLIAIHLCDRGGTILRGADYRRQVGRAALGAGDLLLETVDLSRDLLAEATQVGICVTPDDTAGILPVFNGPTDWNSRRLLLPLPARP